MITKNDEQLIEDFKKFYNIEPQVIAKAPGRIEVLGNHTDYNEGFVLSCAVEPHVTLLMAKKDTPNNILRDPEYSDIEYSFSDEDLDNAVSGDWLNYVKGIIVELQKRNKKVGNFYALLKSTVPLSAGMSSSAALEVAFCFAFKELFNIDLDLKEWAKVGQGVENNYLGLKSGILDQFSSIFGEENSLILSDFRSVEVLRTVKIPDGYSIVVVNSMVKHNLVDSAYNERRESCENAMKKLSKIYPNSTALRDITPEELEAAKDKLTLVEYKRAAHVVGECDRVMKAVNFLDNNNIEEFGKLLFQSHQSSEDNFENSSVELDYLVELAKSIPGALGARLSGGGFGGISIHLVKNEMIEEYTKRIKVAFQMQTNVEPQIIVCPIGSGASVKKL